MAEREGLWKAGSFKEIDCLTGSIGTIDAKGFSRGLSNRIDPPPETKTAAPVGAGNGGDQVGKQASNSNSEHYSTGDLTARFPIIAAHFGPEVLA